jgi:hypothetical protein
MEGFLMGLRNTFSTVQSDIARNKVVNVESLNAFPNPVNNVVTLESGVKYILTKPINTGVLQFTTTAGGTVEITSSNEGTNNWTTLLTNNDALFIGDFGRLQKTDIDFISGTGTSGFYNITATTASRPVLVQERSLIFNFGTLGTIDGASSFNDSMGIVLCKDGITINDSGSALGAGVKWNNISFAGQQGDHMTITGSADFISLTGIAATPASGDTVFNLSGANNTISIITGNAIDTSLGGTTGLEVTYSSDTVLNTIYEYINVDTTSGPVQITLPEATGVGILDGTIRAIIDLGNAETNNITVIPNPLDSTTIELASSYVIDKDNTIVKFELIGDQWTVVSNTDVSSKLQYREETGNYTLVNGDNVVIFNITTDTTATLIDPTKNPGKEYAIINKYTSTKKVTFNYSLNGDSSFKLRPKEVVNIISDGTEYLVHK